MNKQRDSTCPLRAASDPALRPSSLLLSMCGQWRFCMALLSSHQRGLLALSTLTMDDAKTHGDFIISAAGQNRGKFFCRMAGIKETPAHLFLRKKLRISSLAARGTTSLAVVGAAVAPAALLARGGVADGCAAASAGAVVVVVSIRRAAWVERGAVVT
eukprot:COSAG01_NODE_1864_length_9036_cov_10.407519_3_plen_158_part_00